MFYPSDIFYFSDRIFPICFVVKRLMCLSELNDDLINAQQAVHLTKIIFQ